VEINPEPISAEFFSRFFEFDRFPSSSRLDSWNVGLLYEIPEFASSLIEPSALLRERVPPGRAFLPFIR